MAPESEFETRSTASPIELRAAGAAGSIGTLVGYAAKFDSESCLLREPFGAGAFVETIAPGAFARSLRESPDVRALYNHDTSAVLGRTRIGTLRLTEDDTGLAFEVELPDTSIGRDVRTLVAREDITGCSFGFTIREESIARRDDGSVLRTLLDVDLYEISPAVAFPAYQDTEVSIRTRGLVIPMVSLARLNHSLRRLRLLD